MQSLFRAARTELFSTENMELNELKIRLNSIAVFRDILDDGVIGALRKYLTDYNTDNYASFVTTLYKANGGYLSAYVKGLCLDSENVYVRLIGASGSVPEHIDQATKQEIDSLQALCDLTCEALRSPLCYKGFLPGFISEKIDLAAEFANRVKNISKCGYGIYAKYRMFYLDAESNIVPVRSPDSTRLSSLVDYEREQKIILDNTRALLEGKPAANILLTGDAGTGKSSTVKAVVNELYTEGLRIVEVRKDQLCSIATLLDALSENPLKFILFIDDLSFQKDDDNYSALKAVLEGSVSAKSQNVVIYATSNRRHIVKEKFSDREGDDVHRNDTMQEMVSLSERFGIHVTFNRPDKHIYLDIVRHLAADAQINIAQDELDALAEQYALGRGGRSARAAKQFVDGLLAKG